MITSTAERCSMRLHDILEKGYKKLNMVDQSKIASFFSYPYTSEIGGYVLAEAGFHYGGQNDEVVCRLCDLVYSGWRKGDDPKSIHQKKSPNCRFFQSSESEAGCDEENFETGNKLLSGAIGGSNDMLSKRNCDTQQHVNTNNMRKNFEETKSTFLAVAEVPIEEKASVSDQNVSDNAVYQNDTTNSDNSYPDYEKEAQEQRKHGRFLGMVDSATNVAPNEIQAIQPRHQNTGEDLPDSNNVSESHSDRIQLEPTTGPLETVPPKYEQFAVLATRLNSYRHWQKHLKQRPGDLAKAGLFYEGTHDYVRCFHCAGGLREWDPEDDPFYEHARWFPFCPFMRMTKGDKYIMGVQSGTIKPPEIQADDRLDTGQNKEPNMFDHPAVLSVMEMGYSKTILTEAITIYIERNGTDFKAEQLLSIVWEIQENNMDVIPEDETFQSNQTKDNGTETRLETKNDLTELVTMENITKGVDELTEENRELREQKTCKVCLDEEASIVFLPCGHLVTCPMCASALRKCPVCRTFIRGTVKAIVS